MQELLNLNGLPLEDQRRLLITTISDLQNEVAIYEAVKRGTAGLVGTVTSLSIAAGSLLAFQPKDTTFTNNFLFITMVMGSMFLTSRFCLRKIENLNLLIDQCQQRLLLIETQMFGNQRPLAAAQRENREQGVPLQSEQERQIEFLRTVGTDFTVEEGMVVPTPVTASIAIPQTNHPTIDEPIAPVISLNINLSSSPAPQVSAVRQPLPTPSFFARLNIQTPPQEGEGDEEEYNSDLEYQKLN